MHVMTIIVYAASHLAVLRMYCIDTPEVPESSDAGTFHCLYDQGILIGMNSKTVRAASVKHKY